MGKFVIFNGELLPKAQAVLPVDNRGTLYGDGIFETMRCKGVIPPFYPLHWERLSSGLKFLKMDASSAFTKASLLKSIQRLLHKEKHYLGSSIRVNCIRKIGGKYTPTNTGIDYFIEAFPLENDAFELNKKGLKIDLYDVVPKPIIPTSRYKNSNATPLILAGIYAKEKRLDECLIYNTSGYLCESISSNLFVKRGNQIVTPALSSGCVHGTIRKILIDLIPKAGYDLLEVENLGEEALEQAEEVFLSNAVAGIKWVLGYGKKRYFYQTAQQLIGLLNQHFDTQHATYAK